MKHTLSAQILAAIDSRVAVLGLGHYALPVRYRVRGPMVECQVPIWVGSGELVRTGGDVTLVAAKDTGSGLTWLFARGPATLVHDPDWGGFADPKSDRARLCDLYEVLRIEPARLELFDERRGWGFRETVDL